MRFQITFNIDWENLLRWFGYYDVPKLFAEVTDQEKDDDVEYWKDLIIKYLRRIGELSRLDVQVESISIIAPLNYILLT